MAIETSIKSEQQPARKSASQTKARVKKMTRADWNFWLDVFLLLNFMALIWAMVIVQFVFPAGPQSHGWLLWGWTYVDWCNVQFAVLCVMVAAILLHVMLHWSWVCGMVSSRLKRRDADGNVLPGGKRWDEGTQTLIGVGLLIVVLHVIGVAVAAAWLTIQPPPG
ncbi:MAG: hypothetical protein KDA99_05870 [Planctomycetales bacterium]|nr:hypothetical protein [Planctomycetales bacterium]